MFYILYYVIGLFVTIYFVKKKLITSNYLYFFLAWPMWAILIIFYGEDDAH